MTDNKAGSTSPASRIVIVSPSGKLYGSERTLLHFLDSTSNIYNVYAYGGEEGQPLLNVLRRRERHVIHAFRSCFWLYAGIAIRILFRQVDSVYVNEGGHIRYVRLLAKIFRRTRIVVHIRLNEDTVGARLTPLPGNVTLVCTSAYIASQIEQATGISTAVISSPCRGADNDLVWAAAGRQSGQLKVGIIGRVADSKGIDKITSFCDYLEENAIDSIQLNFFGTVVPTKKTQDFLAAVEAYQVADIRLHGFQEDVTAIYAAVDVVLHFNELEPLGVVFFEALNHRRPFVGFSAGGIGEIASELGINELMVDPSTSGWKSKLQQGLESVFDSIEDYQGAHHRMQQRYSVENYTRSIESLF